MLLNDSSASNLISGKNCLNPVNEFEDLQYKMATMQALRYMDKQDSLKKIEQQRRMLTGYNTKTRMSAEEKDAIREKKLAMKDKQERENMG